MNKKEFIKRLIDMGGCGAKPGTWARGWDNAISEVIEIVNELDEPQKPVIPQFVADWIESQDDPIYGMCVNYEMWGVNGDDGTTRFTGEIAEWFDDTLNVENYYRACIDGYEVEKEKLYYIVDKVNNLTLMTFELSDVVGEEIIEFVDGYSENETIHFDSKEKAELIAHFIGNSLEVEEVTE